MPIQKIKFEDLFTKDKNGVLTLQIPLKIKEIHLAVGMTFKKKERISGIDFSLFQYLDLGVELLADGSYELKGFFSQAQ